ncbi:hypothetical protein WJX73_003995 [Symbiochloris irregularis]|uniref:Uncharacterized protein n=1 Tax=Symbiochloris irregularis TaxID=706552 RepID=A0AAW1PZ78_9CHLO
MEQPALEDRANSADGPLLSPRSCSGETYLTAAESLDDICEDLAELDQMAAGDETDAHLLPVAADYLTAPALPLPTPAPACIPAKTIAPATTAPGPDCPAADHSQSSEGSHMCPAGREAASTPLSGFAKPQLSPTGTPKEGKHHITRPVACADRQSGPLQQGMEGGKAIEDQPPLVPSNAPKDGSSSAWTYEGRALQA